MELGMVGLGRMGGNMVRRLVRGGHTCVAFDRDASRVAEIAAEGAKGVSTLHELAAALPKPRVVWVMLPAGVITSECIYDLRPLLEEGDTVVDGGNTLWTDDRIHASELGVKKISFLDVGTSGGVLGLERGYCLMIGGDEDAARRLAPIFRTLAPGRGSVPPTPGGRGGTAEEGFLYCGSSGAGHFVKMIHNGIEYGLMQAYAEGFEILEKNSTVHTQMADVAEVWRRGSVVSSWLLDLTAAALAKDPDLAAFQGRVSDSGEGRWTLSAAIEEGVAAPVIAAALFARFRSQNDHTFGEKLLSAMRFQFGGHVEPPPRT
ncbi:MAG TPA: decarboxylating 6-phosphogluconate dehydrogenase [Planctomycetota bacterium]|jgi:6-phosphogluconate dehydrogenase|nr:decarboxylating 6-phosphogluconate dehydrogenase [Planctomycetota bacterium]